MPTRAPLPRPLASPSRSILAVPIVGQFSRASNVLSGTLVVRGVVVLGWMALRLGRRCPDPRRRDRAHAIPALRCALVYRAPRVLIYSYGVDGGIGRAELRREVESSLVSPNGRVELRGEVLMDGIGRREEIRVPGMPEPISHFTNVVRAGRLVFVSGCVASDAQGRTIARNDATAKPRPGQ